jgi:hypothetical protein
MTDVVLPDTVGGVVGECIVLGLISGSLSAGILTEQARSPPAKAGG